MDPPLGLNIKLEMWNFIPKHNSIFKTKRLTPSYDFSNILLWEPCTVWLAIIFNYSVADASYICI